MNFDLSTPAEKILTHLQSTGIATIECFVPDVERLKHECEELLEKSARNDYLFGKIAVPVTGGGIQQLPDRYPAIAKTFNHKLLWFLHKGITGAEKGFCEDIYITHEYTQERGVNRNGDLHFDRNWSLKFIVYLTDVGENDGPFSIVPGSHVEGRKLRQQGWQKFGKYQDVPNRIHIDFPTLNVAKPVPVTAPAGTLIVFDTDLFHLGGNVQEGHERKLVRGHCRNWAA